MTATSSPVDSLDPSNPVDQHRMKVAADAADARAAQAKVAADRAKDAAKEAAKLAAEANAKAEELRLAADPKAQERAHLTIEQAKARLLDAARAIDPVGHAKLAMRNHPWATVGAAAGAGAVLGSTGGALGALAAVTGSLVKLAKPASLAFGQYAASRMAAQHAAEAAVDHTADVGPDPVDPNAF